jgi:ubiquitin-conjugating enzyme E2 variant
MFAWIGYLIACWIAADFMSGLCHWLEDRYFREEWPIIGRFIAKPNQLHHDQPSAFLRQGYISRNWTTILPAFGAFVLVPNLWPIWLFVSQANEVHAWAHQRCSSGIRMLQETGFLQSAKHHGEHHRSPFDVKYCVMTNWLNPILDGLRVWGCFECLLSKFGFKPNANIERA